MTLGARPMIIMLNGPFGVGKSTVAQRLHDHLPHSMIYDPEIIGLRSAR
jgi:deoxyadenosine/deoxycytidine kinase